MNSFGSTSGWLLLMRFGIFATITVSPKKILLRFLGRRNLRWRDLRTRSIGTIPSPRLLRLRRRLIFGQQSRLSLIRLCSIVSCLDLAMEIGEQIEVSPDEFALS